MNALGEFHWVIMVCSSDMHKNCFNVNDKFFDL